METNMGVKLWLDDRQSAAIIYADDCDEALDAERVLMELLSDKIVDVAEDVSLRDAGYPPGLMKVGQKLFRRAHACS